MIYNNVLEAVGNTPMIRLNRMTDEDSAEILVKFEALNVGGSVKTRTAWNMILDAESRGRFRRIRLLWNRPVEIRGSGLRLLVRSGDTIQ